MKRVRFPNPGTVFWIGLVFLHVFLSGLAWGGELTVAVASNFLNPMKRIQQSFHQQTGHRIRLVSGSTGKLYAQISHGAPYDVFLAADSRRPAKLVEQKLALPGSRFTYALGKLVLWSADPQRIGRSGPQALEQGKFQHLALANVKTAPYGRAALETLQALKLDRKLLSRFVVGENISQTFQFVASGNAELGFVARSQVVDPRFQNKGSHWNIPESLHAPIAQDAVLLKHGQENSGAKALLKFLRSASAREIILKYGYGLKKGSAP